MVDIATTKRLLKVLQNWSTREVSNRRKSVSPSTRKLSLWAFVGCVVAPLVVAILLAVIYHYDKNRDWATASILVLLLDYIGALVYPFIELFLHRKMVSRAIRSPYSSILNNVELIASVDAKYLNIFRRCEDIDLKFLSLELRAQKEALQTRIRLVVGSVEKVGLVPGVLAIVTILAKFRGQQPTWVFAVAYATPPLYIVAMMVRALIMRAERHLELIDFVLAETLTRPSSGRRSRAAA